MTNTHTDFMRLALLQAEHAAEDGEIPVGACIVKNGKVISVGRNSREAAQSPMGHAEINAIAAAAEYLGTWRLDGCILYVTLEPCPMCAGAIINARIERVVYAAKDAKAGCFGSLCDMSAMPFPKVPYLNCGVCSSDSTALLRSFFRDLRD